MQDNDPDNYSYELSSLAGLSQLGTLSLWLGFANHNFILDVFLQKFGVIYFSYVFILI